MDSNSIRAVDRVAHGGTPDQTVLDFSANVNPRRPSGVAAVYEEALETAARYPDDGYPEFRSAAATYVGCEPDRVIPTAGGLAGIRLAMNVFLDPGDSVAIPAPGFGEYEREVRLQGAVPTPVDEAAVASIDPTEHAMVVVCNPNNPTGRVYGADEVRGLLERCRRTGTRLLVDEAFLGFTDEPSVAGAPGAIVTRSLTKLFGLPGLRAGFVVAAGADRDALATARRPWNLGTPAAAVGAHCMADGRFVATTRRRVARERFRMRRALAERFAVTDSGAPFLLFATGDRSVDDVLAATRRRGIAVRDARSFRGLDAHVRVAVRLPDENDRLLSALGCGGEDRPTD